MGFDDDDFIADEDIEDDDDDETSPQQQQRTNETAPFKDPRRHHLRQFLHLFVGSLRPDRKTTSLTLNKRKEPLDKKIRRYLKKGSPILPHLK